MNPLEQLERRLEASETAVEELTLQSNADHHNIRVIHNSHKALAQLIEERLDNFSVEIRTVANTKIQQVIDKDWCQEVSDKFNNILDGFENLHANQKTIATRIDGLEILVQKIDALAATQAVLNHRLDGQHERLIRIEGLLVDPPRFGAGGEPNNADGTDPNPLAPVPDGE